MLDAILKALAGVQRHKAMGWTMWRPVGAVVLTDNSCHPGRCQAWQNGDFSVLSVAEADDPGNEIRRKKSL